MNTFETSKILARYLQHVGKHQDFQMKEIYIVTLKLLLAKNLAKENIDITDEL